MIAQILVVMIAAIAISIFAEKRNIQAPLLLAIVGLAASYLPGLGRLELEPEVILGVVLPPLLYSAASEFSFMSFVKRLGSIVNLGVVLVIVSTLAVGVVASAIVPHMSLPVALVLAAVLSPPDAVTATAIGRKLGLPKRLMTVLKGESLINDAAALTLFSFTVAAVTGTHLFIENIFLYLLYSAVVGVLTGILIGAVVHRIRLYLGTPTLMTVLSVLVPFAAYLLAEEFGASGVLAVVAAGFSLGHNSAGSGYAARIQERNFWRTADALLEAFVFAYIGLQLRFIADDALDAGFDVPILIAAAIGVLVAVIVVRIAWIFLTGAVNRWRYRGIVERVTEINARIAAGEAIQTRRRERGRLERRGHERGKRTFRMPDKPFTWKENLVLSWTGMRGVVTLAAAAGIPLVTVGGEPFPGRDAIQVIAFLVTIGTLLVQGLTLPWLIARLNISDPHDDIEQQQQMALAQHISSEAAAEAINAYKQRQTTEEARHMADNVMKRVRQEAKSDAEIAAGPGAAMLELANDLLTARRAALIAARDARELDDEVMREMLEQMDVEQAAMENWQVKLGKV